MKDLLKGLNLQLKKTCDLIIGSKIQYTENKGKLSQQECFSELVNKDIKEAFSLLNLLCQDI